MLTRHISLYSSTSLFIVSKLPNLFCCTSCYRSISFKFTASTLSSAVNTVILWPCIERRSSLTNWKYRWVTVAAATSEHVGKIWLLVFNFRKKFAISSSVETLSSECCYEIPTIFGVILATSVIAEQFNLLKPTGQVLHQQFNIQQLYVLLTLYLCVLYLSEDIGKRHNRYTKMRL